MTLAEIVQEIDRRASTFEIGALQDLRKTLKGLKRRAGSTVFGSANHEDWAFHLGGREELQFNIGIEELSADRYLRHGVAFSFEPSRSMPEIDGLVPKVERFNDYLRAHPGELAGLEMWHYADSEGPQGRSRNYAPGPIPPHRVQIGTFVFLGRVGSLDQPDFASILADLDRLLPLYMFVEGGGDVAPALGPEQDPIIFRPGCPPRARWAQATFAERRLDVSLRHAALQEALYCELAAEFGTEHIGTENWCRAGGRIDVIVKTNDAQQLYEIKTASTARGCIREAIGQLLDYACWLGSPAVTALFVAGEPPLTKEAEAYLKRLNGRFPVPIRYRQVTLPEQ